MRKLLALFAFAVCTLTAGAALRATTLSPGPTVLSQTPATTSANEPPQQSPQAMATGREVRNVTQYTLPPALDHKAHRLGQIAFAGALIGTLYSWLILLLILAWRLAPKYRDWAERASHLKFLQAVIFAPLLLLTVALLTIPLDIAEQWVSRRFGLSIQSWGSWSWDWAKQEIFFLVAGTFLVWILYAVIGRSPRRWWLYFWLLSLPLMALLVFVQPVVVDPMFHTFVPLEQKDPALVSRLEDLVHRSGQEIPPNRMFWMDAGAKTTELNAYVTGIGASKRIVVWNTTIRAMNTPQIVFVVGHEMGHYVLNHIWKGMAAGAVGLFVLFYLMFRAIDPLLARWGTPTQDAGPMARWGIRSVSDWASLPALLLLISVFSFIAAPIGSAVSRYFEHQADQYGLEVTHGLTPDSGEVAAQSFEVLGEIDLSDPRPNPVDIFLFYSHPPTADRIRFALTYEPWAPGGRPKFAK